MLFNKCIPGLIALLLHISIVMSRPAVTITGSSIQSAEHDHLDKSLTEYIKILEAKHARKKANIGRDDDEFKIQIAVGNPSSGDTTTKSKTQGADIQVKVDAEELQGAKGQRAKLTLLWERIKKAMHTSEGPKKEKLRAFAKMVDGDPGPTGTTPEEAVGGSHALPAPQGQTDLKINFPPPNVARDRDTPRTPDTAHTPLAEGSIFGKDAHGRISLRNRSYPVPRRPS